MNENDLTNNTAQTQEDKEKEKKVTEVFFEDLDLSDNVLDALYDMRFEKCTPVQANCIPPILEHHDVLGVAQTGTGKTAAYLLPLLTLLERDEHPADAVNCLVIAPTRELARQIDQALQGFAYYTNVNAVVVYGGNDGVRYEQERKSLQAGADIVLATPGRLITHLQLGTLDLSRTTHLVLDEADRMLDMGFIHDIKRILKLLPARRQTLFFSATMPPEIETLANSMLTKPEKVEVTPASSTVDIISQQVYFVEKKEKKDLLIHLLKDTSIESVLIFTRTKYGADKLARVLTKAGIGAEAIHGNKTQNARQRALTNFKNHTLRALIATDIAARGIDVDQLSHVINYELPNVPETYVHRIGRTGRAGHEGVAISFCESEELPYLKDIQKLIGKNIPVVKDHPFVTTEGIKAQEEKQEEIKVKAKANKTYRGSRANGDFWRRKKQKTNQPSSTKQEKRK